MYIIAGLGNPGSKYEHTRHNVGFDALDVLAAKHGISMNEKKYKGILGSGYIEGQKVLLVKPQTFMNLSGDCLQQVLAFYKVDPEDELIVLSDDISLEPGRIRIRKKGSAGGHNGLKDIIAKCGTSDFKRIKIGVGEKPEGWDLADHVLGHFSKEDWEEVQDSFRQTVEAIELILQGRIDDAMNQFNAKKAKKEKSE